MDTIQNRIQNLNQRKEEFRQVFPWSPIDLKGQIIHSLVITTEIETTSNADLRIVGHIGLCPCREKN